MDCLHYGELFGNLEFVRSAGGSLDVPGRRGHGMSGEKEVVKKISASDGSFPDSRVRSFIGGEVCMMCVKGSMTIEMAYIMPVIFLVFFLSVTGIFYYHDKNILTGTTYETAVIAGRKQKRESPFSEEEVKQLWRERISGKMILFRKAEVEIRCHKEYVSILAQASRKKLRITASAKAALTEPEDRIRSIRKQKDAVIPEN